MEKKEPKTSPRQEDGSSEISTEHCTNCGEELDESDENGEVEFTEWLTLPACCEKCEKQFCPGCLSYCYECFNEGETYPVLCDNCRNPGDLTLCPCGWDLCEKHKNDCGQCKANRNYDLRHRLF